MSDHDSGEENAVVFKDGQEEELMSKTLMIQSKRFYIDVKQNQRGRFMKIAEVGPGGKKSRLLMPMSTSAELRDKLTEFSEHYAKLGPSTASATTDSQREDCVLKSEMLVKDNRRYYLDLKENKRGRFLRVSMTLPLSRQRPQVVIPAQGMIEMRDALTDVLTECGTDDAESGEPLPEPQSMRVDNKTFYFDVGLNKRGKFMRISEVRTNVRTAITIPQQSWKRFRDVLSEFVDNSLKTKTESVNGTVEKKKPAEEKKPIEEKTPIEDKQPVEKQKLVEEKLPVANGEATATVDGITAATAAVSI